MRARLVDGEGLLDRALRVAGTGQHDAVAVHHLAQRRQRALQREREPVGVAAGGELGSPSRPCVRRSRRGTRCGPGVARQRIDDGGDGGLGVGEDADLGRVDLADLVRVDVDVDQLGRREGERLPPCVTRRRPVGEATSDRHHDVGVGGHVLPWMVPVWPTLPMNRSWSSGKALLPFQVVTTGMLRPSASARTSSVASALIGAAPDDDHWPFGGGQQVDGAPDRLGVGVLQPDRQPAGQVVEVDLGGLGVQIPRHLDVRRAAAAGQHRAERPMHDERQVVDAVGHPSCAWRPPRRSVGNRCPSGVPAPAARRGRACAAAGRR